MVAILSQPHCVKIPWDNLHPLICKPTMPSQFMSIPQEFSMIFPEDVWPKNTNVFLWNTIVSQGLCYFLWIWFPVCWLAECLIYTWTFYNFSSHSYFCWEDISWGDIYPSPTSWLKPLSRTSWHDSTNPKFFTPAHHGKSNKLMKETRYPYLQTPHAYPHSRSDRVALIKLSIQMALLLQKNNEAEINVIMGIELTPRGKRSTTENTGVGGGGLSI